MATNVDVTCTQSILYVVVSLKRLDELTLFVVEYYKSMFSIFTLLLRLISKVDILGSLFPASRAFVFKVSTFVLHSQNHEGDFRGRHHMVITSILLVVGHTDVTVGSQLRLIYR